jgi:hypothetical protein
MRVIRAENVREAYKVGIEALLYSGEREESRAGPVMVMPEPVCTIYLNPKERVLLNAKRDANPFFHFFEGIWMLSGSDYAKYLDMFVSDFSSRFSDDGETLHGAYGYRWREHWAVDQLKYIVSELRNNPQSRRCVLGIWDTEVDLGAQSKDVPCNTHVYFRIHDGRLNMMINCRSNDMIWGGYGANAVHFSMLQEYLAAAIGVEVGMMYQNSWNFHAYCDMLTKVAPVSDNTWLGPYGEPYPLVSDPDTFLAECGDWVAWHRNLFSGLYRQFKNSVFLDIALPMGIAHQQYKSNNFESALDHANSINAPDWRRACTEWIHRRADRWAAKREAQQSMGSSYLGG